MARRGLSFEASAGLRFERQGVFPTPAVSPSSRLWRRRAPVAFRMQL